MTSISEFSGSELELLISLPYKVGVFVSYADDEDGERDDEKEMAALEACIKAIARLHEDKPFTAEVMQQTLAMKSEWGNWAAQSFGTPDAAGQAAALLSARASDTEQKNYKAALMEIASTVAQAYGEFGEFEDESEGGLAGLIGKITGGLSKLSGDDADHPMNVSAAEDSAIEQLRAALS